MLGLLDSDLGVVIFKLLHKVVLMNTLIVQFLDLRLSLV